VIAQLLERISAWRKSFPSHSRLRRCARCRSCSCLARCSLAVEGLRPAHVVGARPTRFGPTRCSREMNWRVREP